jgi:hypothetical protein
VLKKLHSLNQTFALAILFASPTLAANSNDNTEQLRVMLQGAPASELKSLVEERGGSVSHVLHIIDAVGANVTRAQLDTLITSPLVHRYIDDLALGDPVEEKPESGDESCHIAGSLELDIAGPDIEWRLYKRENDLLDLQKLELEWPVELGALTSLSLGEHAFPRKLLKLANPGKLALTLDTAAAPKIAENSVLRARFDSPPTAEIWNHVQQRDFVISADFGNDCSTKLIPGYSDNHNNSYFPSVVGADALHKLGITGSGVTLAVLDSGLWETSVLKLNTRGEPRVIGRYDAIRDIANQEVFDASGHGTHMTSIIAHSGMVTVDNKPLGSYKGISPDVSLVSVKAFNDEGQGEFLDIVRGVQWVVDNRERLNIKVLNLSFAAPPRWPYWQDPINQAVMRAWAAGITVIAAAGNSGPDPMTVGSPGNLPYIITVGAVTDSWTTDTRDDDYIPDFSARGPTPSAHIKPDIIAPGGHISGLTRPGSSLIGELPQYLLKTGEFVMTGTSQASALVAGIAALILQLEPELSPDDVKCMLMSTAEPAINADGRLAYSPFQQGSGYVSATRAITLGKRGCGNEGLDIEADMAGDAHFQGPAITDEKDTVSLPGLSEILALEPAAQGLSKTRKWGAKEHLERTSIPDSTDSTDNLSPLDWVEIYREEAAAMQNLAAPKNR